MSQNNQSNETAEVSNEQLYQEIRKLHRRLIAAIGLVSVAVAGGLYLINPLAAFPPLVVSLVTLVLSAYLRSGAFTRAARLLVSDPPEPESTLQDRLGEPFEVGE